MTTKTQTSLQLPTNPLNLHLHWSPNVNVPFDTLWMPSILLHPFLFPRHQLRHLPPQYQQRLPLPHRLRLQLLH
jgi:hypothetical protein